MTLRCYTTVVDARDPQLLADLSAGAPAEPVPSAARTPARRGY